MIEENATPEATLREARMKRELVDYIDAGKNRLIKRDADALAGALGCPANIVYSVANMEVDDPDPPVVRVETKITTKALKAALPKTAPRKPGPKPGTKYKPRKGASGRPKDSGKNQNATKAVGRAALSVKSPPAELLAGMTRKKAFEQLSKAFGVMSKLCAFLAKDEKD